MKLPIIYKKNNSGSIQFWEIETGEYDGIAWFETTYGQLGTDSPQTTTDYIEKGKNIGKKNQTTALQQAEAEAQAKWEKQKKKGYVESIKDAENDKLDDLIEGGIVPMLAHKFTDHGHKVKYPAYVQPKLDGIRCIAILKDGKCTLWSRTRKQITSMPHIVKDIETLTGMHIDGHLFLDGELYNHDFKNDFEKIVSAVRKEDPEDGYLNVQYHIYDVINESTFYSREMSLSKYLRDKIMENHLSYLKVVETIRIYDETQVIDSFNKFKKEGYEGAMVRNEAGLYVNKRSYDLLKVKEFDDAEFKIIGIDEGRGKLAGHVGAFVCVTTDGKEFFAKMSGETDKLKEYFENHKLWQNKQLTVKYQGLTGAAKVPRFPVGIAIRDYE